MKNIGVLYGGKEQFSAAVTAAKILRELPSLVRIYTADRSPEKAVSLAGEIREVLPLCQIAGCSARSVFY
ncbi:MAG: hypothetical protein RSC76_00390, partial [Oscillospiraceae bacterium]